MSYNQNEAPKSGSLDNMNVIIEDDVYQKIMHWIGKATGEVSGLGKVVMDSGGTMRVRSAILLEQENTGSSTDLDAKAVAKAMFTLRDEPGTLNFWWHSHVNFGVFWSGTDKDTIREIGGGGWVLATVFNKKAESLSAFYARPNDGVPEVFINNLPTKIVKYLNTEQVKVWDAEFDAKCKVKAYEHTPWYGNDYSLYGKKNNSAGTNGTTKRAGSAQTTLPFDQGGDIIVTVKEAMELFGPGKIEEIDELADHMLNEPVIGKSLQWLYKICHTINVIDKNKAVQVSMEIKKSLKKPYIEMFNEHRKACMEAADEQEKEINAVATTEAKGLMVVQ